MAFICRQSIDASVGRQIGRVYMYSHASVLRFRLVSGSGLMLSQCLKHNAIYGRTAAMNVAIPIKMLRATAEGARAAAAAPPPPMGGGGDELLPDCVMAVLSYCTTTKSPSELLYPEMRSVPEVASGLSVRDTEAAAAMPAAALAEAAPTSCDGGARKACQAKAIHNRVYRTALEGPDRLLIAFHTLHACSPVAGSGHAVW